MFVFLTKTIILVKNSTFIKINKRYINKKIYLNSIFFFKQLLGFNNNNKEFPHA